MQKLLSGKIFWVMDDFSFNGNYIPKKDETAHTVTKIENVIIDENMIKFSSNPVDYSGEPFSYNVNLLINDNGLSYSGTFSEATDGDWNGTVSCELFENKKAYFLYGKWTEDDTIFTWWAKVDKNTSR